MDKNGNKIHHIVIVREDNDLDQLAVNKIVGYFNNALVIHNVKELKPIMLEQTPKVIFFSNEHLETSFQQYYALLASVDESELCEHKFVTFCNKKDEDIAFAAYNTDIVDEYLISRPLYEVTRPILLANQLLKVLGVNISANGKVEYQATKLQLKTELTALIENTLERKKVMKEDFEKSIIKLDSAITNAQEKLNNNKKAELNLDEVKDLLAQIKSNEIRPELLDLQNKALSLLNRFVKSTSSIVSKMDTPPSENAREQTSPQNTSQASSSVKSPASKKHVEDIVFDNRLHHEDVSSNNIIKVLLVEDDEISLNLSAKLFRSKRYDFDYAVNGRQALKKLGESKFDIVFMDINLPDSDGLSIVSQLTNNSSLNVTTPIVVLTGSHSKLSVKRAGQVGAKVYLIKPLRQATLQQALKKCNLL
ncbi:hypothetical protein GCM10008107_15990 [Psychrosphaera saromensis]|uniref:Response regulatory domain-containing protein n=1 Tax=Psychrosphaera saromensis TaxID=716813 RepID=A0A2S7UTX4_9GAMM|nr:response regulator [Psychrosphaera saromensis]PQJ53185.1 hypothetical protein BTO11_05565 [Psychrosphaera saromensis]GHB67344.1 hypothetical protein GCM10008107_15990 [Psychrosphaera saromensis]GLQ15055.1 hypothetical protein GCM10007917_25100 [Psychrosphaera saromensis]